MQVSESSLCGATNMSTWCLSSRTTRSSSSRPSFRAARRRSSISARSLKTMKLDADEKEILGSVERGEWRSTSGGKRERTRYTRSARATFRKDRRLNIRISTKDLEAIQKRAFEEGLPY